LLAGMGNVQYHLSYRNVYIRDLNIPTNVQHYWSTSALDVQLGPNNAALHPYGASTLKFSWVY
jgi:hypothetical protein